MTKTTTSHVPIPLTRICHVILVWRDWAAAFDDDVIRRHHRDDYHWSGYLINVAIWSNCHIISAFVTYEEDLIWWGISTSDHDNVTEHSFAWFTIIHNDTIICRCLSLIIIIIIILIWEIRWNLIGEIVVTSNMRAIMFCLRNFHGII